MQIKWSVVMAILLMFVGISVGVGGASAANWPGLALAGIITLAGVGAAVLSLHER